MNPGSLIFLTMTTKPTICADFKPGESGKTPVYLARWISTHGKIIYNAIVVRRRLIPVNFQNCRRLVERYASIIRPLECVCVSPTAKARGFPELLCRICWQRTRQQYQIPSAP